MTTKISGTQVQTGAIGATQLASTAVTPSTYGSSTKSAVITIDADGRITAASEANITGSGGLPPDADYGDITVSSSGSVWTVDNDVVTNAKLANVSTDTIKGRATAGTGDPEDLTALPFAFTGDVTRAADSNSQTIANDAVTYAKMQNVSAADRLLGRGNGGGSGDVQEISLGTNLSLSGTTLNASGGSSPNRDYFKYLALQMEPLAIEEAQVGTFTYTLSAGTPKLLLASYYTKLGSSGRMELRNPRHPLILNTGLSLVGLDSSSLAALADPSLPSYADAEATYYERLNLLASDANYPQKVLALSGTQTVNFLPGPYGSLITQITEFDDDWIILFPYGTSTGFNLWDEIDDSTTQRIGNGTLIPVSKNIGCTVKESGTGSGALVYVVLTSDWGEVADPNTYIFRDDFMGSTLDTTTNWNRQQSSGGNVEIDTAFHWVKVIGNDSWGGNGVYSKTSTARATGLVFECDVFVDSAASLGGNAPNLVVGFSTGAGYADSDFAHMIQFTTSGGNATLQVKENGTSRGNVGNRYTVGAIYRVRMTLQSTNSQCKYEIQGGPEYDPLGGASWTDITPGTSSSSTTPLYAGFTKYDTARVTWIGDVKLY